MFVRVDPYSPFIKRGWSALVDQGVILEFPLNKGGRPQSGQGVVLRVIPPSKRGKAAYAARGFLFIPPWQTEHVPYLSRGAQGVTSMPHG